MHGSGWKVGDARVTPVVERQAQAPAMSFLPAASDEAMARHRAAFEPWAVTEDGQLRIVIQALCVEAGGQRLVVDTCVGPHALPGLPELSGDSPFLDALADAGFGRDDVDVVVCTHLHFDHVGWNTVQEDGRWVPTFRNARYVLAEPEHDHWQAMSAEARAAAYALTFDQAVTPLFEAGQVDLVDVDHRVNDAVRLVPTPGHSPGHVSVLIESGGERALITGDCAHHPVQLVEPDWFSVADLDGGASSETRRRLVAEHADTGTLVIGTHFPPPTAGHLVTEGEGIAFRPLVGE